MRRTMFKSGHNLVVSLPKDLLEPLGVRAGTNVSVELDREECQILIRLIEVPLAGKLSEAFARQVSEFIEQYRPALEALSHK